MLLAASNLWFHWLAWLLVFSAIGLIAATAIGYYLKVLRNKAPRRSR